MKACPPHVDNTVASASADQAARPPDSPVRPPRRPFQPGSGGRRQRRVVPTPLPRPDRPPPSAPTNPPARAGRGPQQGGDDRRHRRRHARPGRSNHPARAADRPRLAAPGDSPHEPRRSRRVLRPTRRAAAIYRAVAQSYRGLAAKRSTSVDATTWSTPDFVDEFDGTTLSPAWEHRIQFYNPWGGLACSAGSPAAVKSAGGALQLGSLPDPTVARRARPTDEEGVVIGQYPLPSERPHLDPAQRGLPLRCRAHADEVPAGSRRPRPFWLRPLPARHRPDPMGSRVDVVEWYGNKAGRAPGVLTVPRPCRAATRSSTAARPKPDRFLGNRPDPWWSQLHVFSMEWTPTESCCGSAATRYEDRPGGLPRPRVPVLSMLSSDFGEPPALARPPGPHPDGKRRLGEVLAGRLTRLTGRVSPS